MSKAPIWTILILLVAIVYNDNRSVAAQSSDISDKLVWSPNGAYIAKSTRTGQPLIVNIETGQIQTISSGIHRNDFGLAWSPNSKHIAIGIRGGLYIWDIVRNQQVHYLASDPNVESIIAWADVIAVAPIDESAGIYLWRDEADRFNRLSASAKPSSFWASDLAWRSDGSALAVTGVSGIIIYQKVASGGFNGKNLAPRMADTRVKTGSVYAFAYTIDWRPNANEIAGGSPNGVIYYIDAETGERKTTWQAHEDLILTLRWDATGARLASLSADGTLSIWDGATQKALLTLRGTGSEPFGTSLTWSPCGGRLAYAGEGPTGEAAARTRALGDTGLQIVIPDASPERLQAILQHALPDGAKRAGYERLLTTTTMNSFIEQVKNASADELSPACRADLLALAEAQPRAAPTFRP